MRDGRADGQTQTQTLTDNQQQPDSQTAKQTDGQSDRAPPTSQGLNITSTMLPPSGWISAKLQTCSLLQFDNPLFSHDKTELIH